MSTIYEVAARAGVSASTVSRVLSGRNRVSPENSRLVRQAAAELSFTPNRTARSLRRKNSELIALVIPDIENPFFTAMACGVEDVARAAGYSVVLCNTDEDRAKEAHYLQIAVSESMSGVIIATAAHHSDLAVLFPHGRPIVAVDQNIYSNDVDSVMVDNRAGSYSATMALLQQGFKRIACITGPAGVDNAHQRGDCWQQAMDHSGEMADPKLYFRNANYRAHGGRLAMSDLLEIDEPSDAVFIGNNMMAVGALQMLNVRGLVPPHFGVATFGALPFSIFEPAAMTVVDLSAREIGATATKMLLDRINRDSGYPFSCRNVGGVL